MSVGPKRSRSATLSFEIFEVHPSSVEVDVASVCLQTQQPERDLESHDAAVVRIERHHVKLLRDAAIPGCRTIGIRTNEAAAAIELDERLLPDELRLDLLELFGSRRGGDRARLDVPGEEVEAGPRDCHHAHHAGDDHAQEDPDPRFHLTGHERSSAFSVHRPRRLGPDPARRAPPPDAPGSLPSRRRSARSAIFASSTRARP